MATTPAATPSRVFLSYSSKNSGFADDLVISLKSYGYDVVVDREDLYPGEPTERRLKRFVGDADTVVCVISEDWVASEKCAAELQVALDFGRRILPVVIDKIAPTELPAEIARLQIVSFVGDNRSYARGVSDLVEALRVDVGWVREQSYLHEKAQEWLALDQSNAFLLQGEDLDRAVTWIAAPRPENTSVLPIVADFIDASRRGQNDREKRRLRGRLLMLGLASVVIIGVLVAAGFYLDGQRHRETQRANTLATTLDYAAKTQALPSEPPAAAASNIAPAVAALDTADAGARFRAGQHVVEAIRAADNPPILGDLIAALDPHNLDALSPNGRFSVLYMLNAYDGWRSSSHGPALSVALDRIQTRAHANQIALDPQTQDCIDKLRAKLAGQSHVSTRCGGQ